MQVIIVCADSVGSRVTSFLASYSFLLSRPRLIFFFFFLSGRIELRERGRMYKICACGS